MPGGYDLLGVGDSPSVFREVYAFHQHERLGATVERLRGRGVSQILLTAFVPDKSGFLRRFADTVMRSVRS